MFKAFSVLIVVLTVSACGSNDEGFGGVDEEVKDGVYAGSITADGKATTTAIGIVTSTNKVALVNLDTIEVFYGTRVGNDFTGNLYATTTVASTAEATTVSGDVFSGTYTSDLGGGSFSLTGDPALYSRSSALSKLEGTWVDTDFTSKTALGDAAWIIGSDGGFTGSLGLGCALNGQFTVVDSILNEYEMTMSVSNCTAFDGNYSGIAVLADAATGSENRLMIVVKSNDNQLATFSSPVK